MSIDPFKELYARLPRWLKAIIMVASIIATIGSAWAAWDQMGLPKLATQGHVGEKIAPVVTGLEEVQRSQYSARIESKDQHREYLTDRKFELELRLEKERDISPEIRSEMVRRIQDYDRRINIMERQMDGLKDMRRMGKPGPN